MNVDDWVVMFFEYLWWVSWLIVVFVGLCFVVRYWILVWFFFFGWLIVVVYLFLLVGILMCWSLYNFVREVVFIVVLVELFVVNDELLEILFVNLMNGFEKMVLVSDLVVDFDYD